MMPLPGSSSRWLSSQPRRLLASGSRSTPRRSDARASGPRIVTTEPAEPSCSATSFTTRVFAVAVVASTGTPAGIWAMRSRRRR